MSIKEFDFYSLKPRVSSVLKERGFEFLPKKDRFAEVYLSVDNEPIPPNCLPKADFAAKHGNDYLFIEVDKDQGVSHNIVKYLYILDRMKVKPEGVTVLHILGPGFLASGNNYIFHKMLATFIADKMKLFFKDSLRFNYVQSEPVLTNETAIEWLKNNLPQK